MSVATDKSPTNQIPGRALKEDWLSMLSSLERNLTVAMDAPPHSLEKYTVRDLVGIYSSDKRFEVQTRFRPGNRVFELTYYVIPVTQYPGGLVSRDCDIPRSYSEINLALAVIVTRLLSQYHHTPHMGWVLKTIVGDAVTPGVNYRMCLQFERQ